MSLQDKTARWIFDARWSQMPDDEVAVHINNTILDAAIEASKNYHKMQRVMRQMPDEQGQIAALEALKEGKK